MQKNLDRRTFVKQTLQENTVAVMAHHLDGGGSSGVIGMQKTISDTKVPRWQRILRGTVLCSYQCVNPKQAPFPNVSQSHRCWYPAICCVCRLSCYLINVGLWLSFIQPSFGCVIHLHMGDT
jgi:hypothetical protein